MEFVGRRAVVALIIAVAGEAAILGALLVRSSCG